jgi:hypothetical protein
MDHRRQHGLRPDRALSRHVRQARWSPPSSLVSDGAASSSTKAMPVASETWARSAGVEKRRDVSRPARTAVGFDSTRTKSAAYASRSYVLPAGLTRMQRHASVPVHTFLDGSPKRQSIAHAVQPPRDWYRPGAASNLSSSHHATGIEVRGGSRAGSDDIDAALERGSGPRRRPQTAPKGIATRYESCGE